MRILIIGNGGREHALLWKLGRDAPDARFWVTRPNGGMMGPSVEALTLAPTDVEALSGWAAAHQIDLAVVGPEAPLAHGLVDRLRKHGVPAFGPTAAAARIETSKAYAKALMEKAGVPTAAHVTFREVEPALAHVRGAGAPIVVKASGLAAGKGAVVCETLSDAESAVQSMLGDLRFGEAGREVVIEEYMEGEELSLFALADGERALPLLAAQDHKRIGEGDTGPNTGGMGAYAPVGFADADLLGTIEERVLAPTLAALAADDAPFRGLLYAGLMITRDGPKVVEFNCRFGDPETQVVLPLMDSPLLPLLERVASGGSLGGASVAWRTGAAVTTVLASAGYPDAYPTGHRIDIPAAVTDDADTLVFHAGTTRNDDGLVTSGGRVLAVTGLGDTVQDAHARSVAAADRIAFEGKQFRRDIGWRERARDERGRP
ncbi:MAG: phosphoribosylamine--glycine ligase [Gemmatimonadota bacterium]|nr:phosphoribosylamine--glycine ligase [Gemmatimonadota bacterium]